MKSPIIIWHKLPPLLANFYNINFIFRNIKFLSFLFILSNFNSNKMVIYKITLKLHIAILADTIVRILNVNLFSDK